MLMQYTCLKYFLKSHKIVSSQVEFWCTLKGKVQLKSSNTNTEKSPIKMKRTLLCYKASKRY